MPLSGRTVHVAERLTGTVIGTAAWIILVKSVDKATADIEAIETTLVD